MPVEHTRNVISAFDTGMTTSASSNLLIPAFDGMDAGGGGRPLGAILIDAGKLSLEEAERALHLQRQEGGRFGEVLLKLGLVTEADVHHALAEQFDYPYVIHGDSEISREVIAAYQPSDPSVEAFRALRAQITMRWSAHDGGGCAFSVVSPDRSEGRSYLAANLAVVFAQLGERTVLIDADMRNPRQHQLFGVENRSGLSAILSGRGDETSIQHIPIFRELSIIPAGALPPNPQELVARPYFARLIENLARQFAVIIVDTPAGANAADAQFISKATRSALMVVRRNTTHLTSAKRFVEGLGTARVMIIGTVLNES